MFQKHNLLTVFVLFAIFILISGCANEQKNSNKTNNNKKLEIVTTFYPMYEFTKNIVQDKANVKLLVPSNIEPHDWEPSPKDVGSIQQADLMIYNSTYLETWVPSIEKSVNRDHLSFVEASSGIDLMEGTEHHKHEMDPHVWLSPVLAQQEVKTITNAVIKADPKNKTYYQKNSDEYVAKLAQLDNNYRTALNNVKRRELITQHAAFGYLTKEYGIKQVPIAGLSPSQEPSPAKLGELKEFALKHKVKTIFFEELTSPKVAETLATEIGAKTEVLHTLEGLSKNEQEQGLNYITIMHQNLEAIKKSLDE
ncbi:metal ABC transporter substrate-binding protein [Heyndrickxia sp. NPDC080065]|uniref:metal ABC transporter substrate-binding protein n=1 Tax=Heyndrickxia sp. NPDC080065 TaxID=3390568 RepID=UPI003CFF5052